MMAQSGNGRGTYAEVNKNRFDNIMRYRADTGLGFTYLHRLPSLAWSAPEHSVTDAYSSHHML